MSALGQHYARQGQTKKPLSNVYIPIGLGLSLRYRSECKSFIWELKVEGGEMTQQEKQLIPRLLMRRLSLRATGGQQHRGPLEDCAEHFSECPSRGSWASIHKPYPAIAGQGLLLVVLAVAFPAFYKEQRKASSLQ